MDAPTRDFFITGTESRGLVAARASEGVRNYASSDYAQK